MTQLEGFKRSKHRVRCHAKALSSDKTTRFRAKFVSSLSLPSISDVTLRPTAIRPAALSSLCGVAMDTFIHIFPNHHGIVIIASLCVYQYKTLRVVPQHIKTGLSQFPFPSFQPTNVCRISYMIMLL